MVTKRTMKHRTMESCHVSKVCEYLNFPPNICTPFYFSLFQAFSLLGCSVKNGERKNKDSSASLLLNFFRAAPQLDGRLEEVIFSDQFFISFYIFRRHEKKGIWRKWLRSRRWRIGWWRGAMYQRYGSMVPLTLHTVPVHCNRVQFSLFFSEHTFVFQIPTPEFGNSARAWVQGQHLNGA